MRTLSRKIEDLLYQNASDQTIAAFLKQEMHAYYETLEETFRISGGKDFLVKHTRFIDTVVQTIYRVAIRELFGGYAPMKNALPLAITALGSYGREQLSPHSDIDIMFVYQPLKGYNTEALIEKILYLLWDSGLKLGHRVHSIDELFDASKEEITIKTAIIEARLIEGSSFVWTQAQNIIDRIRHHEPETFIRQKLQEQAQRHRKFPLTMEPNLKEGVGGFRDANVVYWIGRICYNTPHIKDLPSNIIRENEYRPFRIALEFLFRVRSALHLTTQKKSDTLRLDLIPHCAKLLGFSDNNAGHIKCAKKVIGSMKIIDLYTTIWIQRLIAKKGLPHAPNSYLKPVSFAPTKLLDQLLHAGTKPFTPHPTFLDALTHANFESLHKTSLERFVRKLLDQPYAYAVLETLSKARCLKEIIPPIKHVIDLPQFDGYHQYTVDIHSIRCVYHLEHINDPYIASLYDQLDRSRKALLKLVVFLHDAGKGRKRDHHQVGATLFRLYAKKLRFTQTLVEEGERLILYHTLMSNVAQREDIYNEKTVLSFTSHFPSKHLLDMIYVLTYADMNGVGKGVYNSFNANLIRTLYLHAIEALENTQMLDEIAKRGKKERMLQKNPAFIKLSKTQQKKILQIPSNQLFLRYEPEQILSIAKRAFQTASYRYHITNDGYLSIEIVRHPNATLQLAYLLYRLRHLDVANMDIFKLFDNYKYFKIDFSHEADREEIPHIASFIETAFQKPQQLRLAPPKLQKDDIEIDCNHSKSLALMQLRAPDQKGLLAYLIHLFETHGIDIATAKVHTIKNRIRDMFLIEKNGNFCHNSNEIIRLLTGNK